MALGVLVAVAVIGAIVGAIALLVRGGRGAMDFAPRNLVRVYLYIASMAGIIVLVVGLSGLLTVGFAAAWIGYETYVVAGLPYVGHPDYADNAVVARTVERMQQHYDSRPEELQAALGPAIGACCFEVGPEVLDAFRREFGYAEELISAQQESGKGHLNLNRANVRQLIDCGLSADRIYDSGLCTYCRNDLFFSYRRERGAEHHTGRLMGVVGFEI